ncbi:type I secretion protein TolC, partial [Desulfovibrio desulfuricans]|nr:type I secretion protein TolC [Desulfovibrio desulfuricans]
STVKQIIWGALFSLLLATAATAAETGYPPPPPAGKPLSVEDSIYGVLRNHHNLRGMIENREVLDHEVRRAQAGFGPRVDVTGQAAGARIAQDAAASLP